MLLLPSCRETTRLASESLDRQLSPWQRMKMLMHLMMCGPCRRARRLMSFLRQAGSRLSASDLPGPPLSPASQERFKEALRRQLSSDGAGESL